MLQNNLDTAAALAVEVIETWPEDEDARFAMQNLAAIAALRGNAVVAAKLLGFTDEWVRQTGTWRYSEFQATYDVLMRAIRDRLSGDTIDRLKAEGAGLSFDEAVDEAHSAAMTLSAG